MRFFQKKSSVWMIFDELSGFLVINHPTIHHINHIRRGMLEPGTGVQVTPGTVFPAPAPVQVAEDDDLCLRLETADEILAA